MNQQASLLKKDTHITRGSYIPYYSVLLGERTLDLSLACDIKSMFLDGLQKEKTSG